MATSEEAMLGLIDRIYRAVERPELWREVIVAIGETVGGRPDLWAQNDTVALGPGINPSGKQHTFFLSRQDLRRFDRCVEESGDLIARFLKSIFLSVLWGQDDLDNGSLLGAPIANRYLAGFETVEGTSVSLPAVRNLVWALWTDGRGFSSENLRCMAWLMPHLERALRLQMRIRTADLQTRLMSGALDYLTLGVIFVDASGQPLWQNRRAREIIGQSAALRVSPTGLAGQRGSDTTALRKLIRQVVNDESEGVLAISRDTTLKPLLLVVMPLKNFALDGAGRSACGVIFITDPERLDHPPAEVLRRAFDLTYREAQTAIAVARGHGLQTAADTMGVAVTTARSQLQQAFAKTGTNHQAELAALVHQTLSALRHT